MLRIEPYDMKMRAGAKAPNPLFCANAKSVRLVCLEATLAPASLRFGDQRPNQLRMMLTMAMSGLPLNFRPRQFGKRLKSWL